MANIAFYGSCVAVTVIAPICLSTSINNYSPLTYQVHQWALNCQEGEERAVQLLHYFAKPADRIIQAIVAPIFEMYKVLGFVESMLEGLKSKDYTLKAISVLGLVISPLAACAFLIAGLAESTLFLLNGALQVVVPYQALYAVFKGKEAAKEYFEVRAMYERKLKNSNMPKCFVWKNPPNVEEPATSIYVYNYIKPLVGENTLSDLRFRLSEKEFFVANLIMNPGTSLSLIRMIFMT